MATKKEVTERGGSAAPARRGLPFSPLAELHREVDRLFDEFMGEFRPWRSRVGFWGDGEGAVAPKIDVSETDKEVQVTADMPGMDEKDIEVSVDEGRLMVRGEKTEERKEEKDDYRLSERHYGSFQRTFQLPPGVDSEKIDARYKNGVLTLTLPKTEAGQKKQRKISIKAS